MARRRSLNRRWSRRSLNATELDQDSEIIDDDNPVWWKNIQSDTTMRPSLPISVAETTSMILDSDSRVEPSELQDKWWDNLDRTKLTSSRRFSTRESLNPADTGRESFLSEGDEDVSIKKRKVFLRPRVIDKSRGDDNFLKAFNESDATVRSEPVPGKRKSESPMRSDTELLKKKTRTRRSQAAETSKDNPEDASLTSNDTEVIVKPRPKAFKKRFTAKHREDAFDDVLQNAEPGPSGINKSKNVSRLSDSPASRISANATPGAIDSNESGLMGPPKTASLRKRLSTISRKLSLTSDESENEGVSKRAKSGFANKARQRLSVNPFDEILSGQIDEENLQSELQTNKSSSATKTPNKSRQSRGDDASINVSSNVNDDDETSTMVTVPMSSDSASKTQFTDVQLALRNSSIDVAATSVDETKTKEIPRDLKKHLESKSRSTLLKQSTPVADSSIQMIQEDWESSEDEELISQPSKSTSNVTKRASSIMKSPRVSIARLSSKVISANQSISQSEKSKGEEEIVKAQNRSLRSTSHSRIIADSAYELPDKERSDSPIISLSESENDRSADKSKRITRESASRSIPLRANVSRQSGARINASRQKIDSDISISEDETQNSEKSKRRSTIGNSRRDSAVNASRKSDGSLANVSRQRTTFDDAISEDEADDEPKNNSKSASLSVKKKSSARKSMYGNTSRKLYSIEESSSDEEFEDAEKSNAKSTKRSLSQKRKSRKQIESDVSISEEGSKEESPKLTSTKGSLAKRNSSRQLVESYSSISEEEPKVAEHSISKSTRRSPHSLGRNSNVARNSSVRDDISGQGIESGDARDASNSKSSNRSAKRKASVAKNSSANVTARDPVSEDSVSEDDERVENTISPRPIDQSPKKKVSTARKSIARSSVTGRSIKIDDPRDASNSQPASSFAKTKASVAANSSSNVNTQAEIFEDSDDQHDERDVNKSNSTLANPSAKRNTIAARQSIAQANVTSQRIESDESSDEDNTKKITSKSVNLSAKGKIGTSRKSNSRANVSTRRMQSEEQDAHIEENIHSKSTDLFAKSRTSTARKSRASGNVSAQRRVSKDSNSEEEQQDEEMIKSQSANLSPKRKTSAAHGNVFAQTIEYDRSSDKKDAEKGTSRTANLSLNGKSSMGHRSAAGANVSGQYMETESQNAHDTNKTNTKSINISAKRSTITARKSIARGSVSAQPLVWDESSDEDDFERRTSKSVNLSIKGKMSSTRKSTAGANVSGRYIESEEQYAQETNKTDAKSVNLSAKRKTVTARKSTIQRNVTEKSVESDESEEEVENAKIPSPAKPKQANKSTRLSKNSSIVQNTSRSKRTFSTAEIIEEGDSTIAAGATPATTQLTKLPNNQSNSVNDKANVPPKQSTFTEFCLSILSLKPNTSGGLQLRNIDDEQRKILREALDKKIHENMKEHEETKKTESRRLDNALKPKNLRTKVNLPKATAPKPVKVVDRAYIVNGKVYKRPKLPRPKPWATDRLYRYLWKKMEPKYDLMTRVKSEKFVVQLAEVVALTVRRKKYENYKFELDALMKLMARHGIIKTRNDFYDFCYDFLPYEFRIKATPILMPGNISNIPYDPKTLHTPILEDDSIAG